MGVQKTVTMTCDLNGCTSGQNGPSVISYNETLVNSGKEELPELAKYVVLLNHMNELKSFCCQLHAATFFLPPGYEAKQKQVIELPKSEGEPATTLPWLAKKPVAESESWMDEPLRSEIPENGLSQPDGFGPEAA